MPAPGAVDDVMSTRPTVERSTQSTDREIEEEDVIAEIAQFEADLATLQRERDEWLDTTRRLQADFENYRKRVAARADRARRARRRRACSSSCCRCSTTSSSRCASIGARAGAGPQGRRARVRRARRRVGTQRSRAHRSRWCAVRPERARGGDAGRRRGRAASSATCMRTGWKLKGRVLRPAMVKVTEELAGARSAIERPQQREWFEKDYYDVLGVPEGSDRQGARARLQEAREAATTPTRTTATRTRRSASRRSPPRTTCSATATKRKEYDEVRRMVASGAGPRRRLRPRRSGRFRRWPDVPLRDRRRRRLPRDLLGGMFGGAGGGRRGRRGGGAAAGPQRGQDLETELHLVVRRRGARRHQHGAVPLRRGVLDLSRQRRRARYVARDVPAVPRRRDRSRSTRARSRSRRCARRAAGAARSSRRRARRATAGASRCATAR